MRRSPRPAPWCARPRSGSRSSRCRRRGPARIAVAFVVRPSAAIAASASATFSSGTPEISRFCQTVRRISPSPRSAAIFASPRICVTVILPTGNTTPIQFSPACFCARTPICAARSKAGRGFTASAGARVSLRAELLLDGDQEFLKAPGVEHVFQPRLVAVGAVAMLDEHAHDRVGDFRRVLRLDHHAGIAREVAMARDAAERKAEPDARLDAEARR